MLKDHGRMGFPAGSGLRSVAGSVAGACRVGVLGLLLAACSKAPPPAPPAMPANHPSLDAPATALPSPPPDAVLARAGTIVITVADANAALAAMPAGDRLEVAASQAAVTDLVSSLVDQRLMAAAAGRAGLGQDVAGKDGREQEIELASRWLAAELARVPVTSAAQVAAYYAAHRGEFTEPARTRVSRVVAADEAAAQRARAALGRGASLEDARAAAGAAAQAGEFWIQDVPGSIPLEAAVLQLAPGAVGKVGAVAGGFAVFRAEEQVPARTRALDEVRDGIRIRLDDQSRQAAAEAARARLREGLPVTFEAATLTSYAERLARGG